jgi:hypothetical protein
MCVTDLSPEVIELVQRRVGDAVYDSVQKRLNRIYGAIAAGGVAVGGFAVYSLAQDVRQSAFDTAKQSAHAIVEEEVKPAVRTAQEQLQNAAIKLFHVQLRIDMVDEVLNRNIGKVHAAEERVDEVVARATQTIARTQEDLKSLGAQLVTLQEDTDDQVQTIRDASADLATLTSLHKNVQALNVQVSTLGRVVQTIAHDKSIAVSLEESELADFPSSLAPIAKATEMGIKQLQSGGRFTVFLQFADMPQGLARRISTELRDRDYVVPGGLHRTMDSGMREVRYFAEADRAKAQQLALDTTAALEAAGVRGVKVDVKGLAHWQGRKPRQRALELWLSLPAASSSPLSRI